jgi:hypothetical protein
MDGIDNKNWFMGDSCHCQQKQSHGSRMELLAKTEWWLAHGILSENYVTADPEIIIENWVNIDLEIACES